jgi:hypothetical protein
VEGFCEHGNELSDSIKCLEILEWLSDWRLLKKAQLRGVSYIRSEEQGGRSKETEKTNFDTLKPYMCLFRVVWSTKYS